MSEVSREPPAGGLRSGAVSAWLSEFMALMAQRYPADPDKSSAEAVSSPRILIVEDEPDVAALLRRVIDACGAYPVSLCATAECLDLALSQWRPDLVFTDLAMPGLDGFEVIRRVHEHDEDVPVVVVSAYASLENAVKAVKLGAFDFLAKPFTLESVDLMLEKVGRELEVRRRAQQACRQAQAQDPTLATLLGKSPAMQALRDWICRVRAVRVNVLIEGETGTGKELVARALHQGCGPFIPLNLAALPIELAEAELFGCRRGAYSGAVSDRMGLIEAASGGVLFLDEVNAAPPALQAKLLRVLEDKRVRRLGDAMDNSVDVRFIAASNQDLGPLVERGAFRRDLYHRLKVLGVRLPPLRERREDIPALAEEFVQRYARAHGCSARRLSAVALDALMAMDWPGNIRELENWIEQAVILCPPGATEIPAPLGMRPMSTPAPEGRTLAAVELAHIHRVLDECEGNKSRAARILGIDYKTLLRKLAG